MDLAADFGQDRERVGIPFEQNVVGLNLGAVSEKDLGAVHHRIPLFFATLLVNNGQDAVPVHGDQLAFGVLDRRDAHELDETVGFCILLGLFARTGGSAADV